MYNSNHVSTKFLNQRFPLLSKPQILPLKGMNIDIPVLHNSLTQQKTLKLRMNLLKKQIIVVVLPIINLLITKTIPGLHLPIFKFHQPANGFRFLLKLPTFRYYPPLKQPILLLIQFPHIRLLRPHKPNK